MQLTQYRSEQNGKLLVYVDPGKVEIPIPESVTKPDGSVVLINTDELRKQYKESQVTEFLRFNAETYDTLTSSDPESWSIVFKSVNTFLATLNKDDHLLIAMTFIAMHKLLRTMTSATMSSVVDKIGMYLVMLDKEIDLVPKLIDFTDKYMPLPNLDNAGERPHDTAAMTFLRPHMVQLTSVALMCKLLTPIFGQFFWQYKNSIDMDNSIKEIHCAAILKPIFENRYRDLILKLNYFVANTIVQHYKKKDDIVSIYGGNTIDSQALNGVSSIYTRKFITVDLNKQDGNLMTYVTVCLTHSVETQYKSSKYKNTIMERDFNGIKDAAVDEGNASRLEDESVATAKTAEIPIIASWSARHLVKLHRQKLNISDEDYESAMAYYRRNLPPMTCISNYLLCTYFGREMGGAAGIAMLPATIYAELAVILQCILISDEYKFYGLAHAIMITPLNRTKPKFTEIDNKVRMTWANTFSFQNFKQKFPNGIGNTECSAKLKDIVEFLTVGVHVFNTAPAIWHLIGEESRNASEYQCTHDIMETLCGFINRVTEERNEL